MCRRRKASDDDQEEGGGLIDLRDEVPLAVSFRLDVRREPGPAGGVVVVLDGTCLPCQW